MSVDEIYELISNLTLGEKTLIYTKLQNELIEEALLKEAEKRMKNAKEEDFIPEDEVLKSLGITKEQLNNIDVEIE